RRIFSPPGTSPTPLRPALSVRISRLRVKNGPCAPLRLSSMLSRPATGTTRSSATRGVDGVLTRAPSTRCSAVAVLVGGDLARLDQLLPARVLVLLERRELL